MSVSDKMNQLRQLRKAFNTCSSSSYKQRGMRRLSDAERFLIKNYDYALSLILEAQYELQYAIEHTRIQELRNARDSAV